LSVMLVEKDDLASHTSSASSKLVHGGLRYLEQYDFKLVRESLAEREILLRAAPHIVEPLQFVMPLGEGSRPAWMLRAGLFLYGHLGGRSRLPGSRAVRLDRDPFGEALSPGVRHGYTYWDCRVQDSRLVVLNALDAAERGATVLTHTELVEAHREDGAWTAQLRGPAGGQSVRARVLVNAAGAWAAKLFDRLASAKRRRSIRLLKGSHIVIPRLYAGDHAFILQNPDGRVVFAIPFEEKFTFVGTTEVPCNGPLDHPRISDEEFDYLCDTVGRNFRRTISRDDVIWSYSGLRALVDDGSSNPSRVTRDYVVELDANGAPLLSVFGGKLTTYRRLAERAVDRIGEFLPTTSGAWTGRAFLPGGVITDGDLQRYSRRLFEEYEALPPELLSRLVRTYGTRTERLLESVRTVADLGEPFGAGLYAREVDYLVANEWARTAEDILFRRTKLCLHLDREAAERLAAYLAR
ncbi:MAG TPA: glycerol-3-phosphate dehydrogenase, partial [Sphingomicrobium sp.]|nr:glycerol-3-phosphate dehydrogenase [Sphingomicrobium sp.]